MLQSVVVWWLMLTVWCAGVCTPLRAKSEYVTQREVHLATSRNAYSDVSQFVRILTSSQHNPSLLHAISNNRYAHSHSHHGHAHGGCSHAHTTCNSTSNSDTSIFSGNRSLNLWAVFIHSATDAVAAAFICAGALVMRYAGSSGVYVSLTYVDVCAYVYV